MRVFLVYAARFQIKSDLFKGISGRLGVKNMYTIALDLIRFLENRFVTHLDLLSSESFNLYKIDRFMRFTV